jgi:hypothetical protein
MAQPSRGQDAAALAGEIIQAPDLSYTTAFAIECSERTWNRLADDPVLAGQLWLAYGYAPAYRVTMRADTMHVEDPTGLLGDAVRIGQELGDRTYLVYGKLNHWAVPFFNEGIAVIAVRSHSADGRLRGTVEVSLRGQTTVASLVLRAGRSLLMEHVANRADLNLQDAARICAAIEQAPEQVMAQLDGEAAARFKAAFGP